MRVTSWKIEVYEGRSATVRTRFQSGTRATRLRRLVFKNQPGPDGPICLDAELTIGGGADVHPLDYVSLFLNGAATPVYTGRVSSAPPFEVAGGVYTWAVQGHYELSKRMFQSLSIENHSGDLRPAVEAALSGLLGAGNVRHVAQPIGTVQNWQFEGERVRLDSFMRDVDDRAGGGLAFGWGPDRKFVVGFKPDAPVRVLGRPVWEPRGARVANTLYVTTGGTFQPVITVIDQASRDADGPLEDALDLSGLVQFQTRGLGPQAPGTWTPGENVKIDWSFPGASYQSPTGSQSGNYSLEFTLRAFYDGGFDDLAEFVFGGTRTGPDENNLDTTTYEADSGSYTRLVEHAYTNITLTQTFPIFPQLAGPSASLVTEDYSTVRARCADLLADKYAEELRGTVTVADHYVQVGGSVRARYREFGVGPEQEVMLRDQLGTYTLEGDSFKSAITGGTRRRYSAEQQLRNRIEAVAKQVTGGGTL